MAERCTLTDLLPSDCAHCRGKVSTEEEMLAIRRRLLSTGRWMPALYLGTCAKCGEAFRPGAAIQMQQRQNPMGWWAECCAGEDRRS